MILLLELKKKTITENVQYVPLCLNYLTFSTNLLSSTPSTRRNKECPTCRKKLVSRRSLRRDANFDALISKIYPSREEYEAHQQRVLERLNHLHNQEALSSSIEAGLRQQARCKNDRSGPIRGASSSEVITLAVKYSLSMFGLTLNGWTALWLNG